MTSVDEVAAADASAVGDHPARRRRRPRFIGAEKHLMSCSKGGRDLWNIGMDLLLS